MILSEIGLIASKYWLEIPDHFHHVKLDEFVVMPNHIHGILILDYSMVGPRHGVALQTPSRDTVGSCHGMTLPDKNMIFHDNTSHGNNEPFADNVAPDDQTIKPIRTKQTSDQNINHFSKPVKNSVSVIVNQYKSSLKRWCDKNGFEHFQWQARFYDQILHNENSIENIREYINNNTRNWTEDVLYN